MSISFWNFTWSSHTEELLTYESWALQKWNKCPLYRERQHYQYVLGNYLHMKVERWINTTNVSFIPKFQITIVSLRISNIWKLSAEPMHHMSTISWTPTLSTCDRELQTYGNWALNQWYKRQLHSEMTHCQRILENYESTKVGRWSNATNDRYMMNSQIINMC